MAAGSRPVAFDVTHLVSRLNRRATTGIDRVDLAFARRFAAGERLACGLHYGWWRPHVFDVRRVRRLVERFDRKVGDLDSPHVDHAWENLREWLTTGVEAPSGPAEKPHQRIDEGWRAYFDQCALRVANEFRGRVPEQAVYLNVAQSAFEFPRFFEWLPQRPDVTPVFLVHDLLPLDHPEFFRSGYENRFNRRVETIVRHAKAIITTSMAVKERIVVEYGRRGIRLPPIHVQHLPSPLGSRRSGDDEDAALAEHPYFVFVATLEPRKNHKMILHIWRELGPDAPKLVLVGADGWDHENLVGMLERSPALRKSVRRVSGLSRPALRKLIANASALLMPSFGEGYGLPVVEALSLNAPVIASDIPIFRETARDGAVFLSPLDGLAWKSAIKEFARSHSPARSDALTRARAFQAPQDRNYFAEIEGFLDSL